VKAIRSWLGRFRIDPQSRLPETVQKALFLARQLQERAAELQTPQERRQQAELDRMLQNPQDKATLTQMTDQAFRSKAPHRAVDQFIHILDVQGVPRFFSPLERTLLKGFQSFGGYLPGVAVPLVKDRMRHETANVILPAEQEMLTPHLRERCEAGVRMNVNYLGEAILGEEESRRRLETYLAALQVPEIEVVSVKISTLYSQISVLAREHTISVVCDRLELLYRAAAHSTFLRADGTTVPKFVYLDMEEYRDLSITAEAFMRTLDRRGLDKVSAGIALQAYVPDSFRVQMQINEWARRRVAKGGAPVTIRVVKGANMEMERVEASLRGWPQAPFQSKVETDANYKRMLEEGMKAENRVAVRLGVASHNLFDLAYGLALAAEQGAFEQVQFEMLEGMANHQRRALFEVAQNLLLYAPVCRKEDFIHAIGYLIRRLDENTGPENFLRHAFMIHVGSPEWQRLEAGFVKAFEAKSGVRELPRRTQNRLVEPQQPPRCGADWTRFTNEPDTDFSLPQNGEWARQIVTTWEPRCGANAVEIPLVVAGEEILPGGTSAARPIATTSQRGLRECLDPSRPGAVVGRYLQATADDIERAVACAAADGDGWRRLSPADRHDLLGRVAQEIRKSRADLIGAALANGGKTILESDPEVSEAVDFVEFYASTARSVQELPGVKARGKGVIVVVSPWNFPIAIPCGGVAAALAAGNTVILKPASDAVLVACVFCQCFWRAGVSRKALQFVPCSGGREGQQLVTHPKVDAVILTGGTETALAMLKAKPDLHLLAETGGKNATVVTALADRDQAIKHVLHSAFSHSGQKCSATSLLLLEAEVFDDAEFKRTLCDAVESLTVGSAWELKSKMGPLIRPPSGDLETGLKVLEPGESWAVLPRRIGDNPNLWSPGVKWGVQPGSYTHLTEFFGPVLGVMRFEKLTEAIALVNQTGYGLTSGLESLDDREQEIWKAGIRAGNLYINRPTTGAIVLRQPFGGMGKSAFGPGIKAGGPNYVAQFMEFSEAAPESSALAAQRGDGAELADAQLGELRGELRELARSSNAVGRDDAFRVSAALESYDRAMKAEFGCAHDHLRLVGQDNFRRYLPVHWLRIRAHADDTFFDLVARVCAAKAAGCRITVSVPEGMIHPAVALLEDRLTASWAAAIEFVSESDDDLAEVIRARQTDRIRYAAPNRVPPTVWHAAAETGLCIVHAPVLAEGRIELLWYVQEQSVSFDYHRYGNLGVRAAEERATVL
jgi:RHH-type proline utilization regulon transcriptional repressor/proline dehydrogenase/delta 1-pyrroline-5-carboxylate dehydrogenase